MLKPTFIMVACMALVPTVASYAVGVNELSENTKWVLAADFNAANASPLVKSITEQIDAEKRKQAEAKVAAIQAMFGTDLLKDIDYIVLSGAGSAEKGVAVYVYGKYDQQRLSTILAGADNYSSVKHEGTTVHCWMDKSDKKQKYLAFAKSGLVLLSDQQQVVKDALDVLGGRKPCLQSGSPLAQAFRRSTENIIGLYASDLSSIVGEAPQAAILKQAQGLALRIRVAGEEALNADLAVTADTAETAQQVQQTLLGVQAFTLLRAAEAPELATLASRVKITLEGKAVGVTLNLPKSIIEKTLQSYQTRDKAVEQ